ncbi:MAG: ComEC/Rec2 family competence protein, partial [Proteobacteria bacterium]|nr:ComEC/Rec2 family competence protein [Pseudomonadota bacterium]
MVLRLTLVAFACGTLAVQFMGALLPWPAVAAAAVVGTWCAQVAMRRGGRRAAACGIAAALLAGAVLATARAHVRLEDALPRALEGVPLTVTGTVDGMPTRVADGARFVLRVESVVPPSRIPGRLALGWYPPQPSPVATGAETAALTMPRAGERWRLAVTLKRPHGVLNFGGFDIEAWLFERGLRATGAVRPGASNVRLAGWAGDPRDLVDVVREHVRDRLVAALGERRYAGVVVALAIGDQAAIPEAQWRVFNATGVAHLISISGLHITVFATLVGGFAWRIVRRMPALTRRVPARRVAAAVGLAA